MVPLKGVHLTVAGGANNGFAFIGPAAFTALGQLRFFQTGGNTIVELNTTGGTAVDAGIQLNGLVTLDAADFLT